MKTKPEEELLYSLHRFNQLNNRIVQQIGQVFNFDAEKYCSSQGIIYNIIEDNPVPSLDEAFKKVIDNTPNSKLNSKDKVNGYLLGASAMYNALQNGVETNKEQPKNDISYFSRYKE